MSSRDDTLDDALRQLREASNPSADERARILAALQGLGTSPMPAAPERALSGPTRRLGVGRFGAGRRSVLGRRLLGWGVALGLATFGIGVGVGFGLGRVGAVVPPPELAPIPMPAAPAATPAPSVAAPQPPGHELRTAPPRLASVPPPPAVQRRPKPRPKARAPSDGPPAQPAPSQLTLAEALQLLHRAERAIYSDNAAWAVSLLDQLDERAPRGLLHEERLATRVLALCADGQVEGAKQLARQAREEAPTSIYGAILERACDSVRIPTTHAPSR
jgi:hypothetical protein